MALWVYWPPKRVADITPHERRKTRMAARVSEMLRGGGTRFASFLRAELQFTQALQSVRGEQRPSTYRSNVAAKLISPINPLIFVYFRSAPLARQPPRLGLAFHLFRSPADRANEKKKAERRKTEKNNRATGEKYACEAFEIARIEYMHDPFVREENTARDVFSFGCLHFFHSPFSPLFALRRTTLRRLPPSSVLDCLIFLSSRLLLIAQTCTAQTEKETQQRPLVALISPRSMHKQRDTIQFLEQIKDIITETLIELK